MRMTVSAATTAVLLAPVTGAAEAVTSYSKHRGPRCWILVFATLLSVSIGCRYAGADQRPPSVKFIARKIMKRQEAMRTIRYEADVMLVTHAPRLGRCVVNAEYTVTRKGDLQSLVAHTKIGKSEAPTEQEHTRRSVLAEKYVATRFTNSRLAHQYMTTKGPRGAPKAVHARQLHRDADLRAFGTGDGYLPLGEKHLENPRIGKWETARRAGEDGEVIEIRAYLYESGEAGAVCANPRFRWVVDPRRGYLITHVEWYDEQGRPSRQVDVAPRELPTGGWVPKTVEVRDFVYGLSAARRKEIGLLPSQGNVIRRRTIRFRTVEINREVPEGAFTLAFLRLGDDGIIQRVNVDGSREHYVYRDRVAVPLGVAWSRNLGGISE